MTDESDLTTEDFRATYAVLEGMREIADEMWSAVIDDVHHKVQEYERLLHDAGEIEEVVR